MSSPAMGLPGGAGIQSAIQGASSKMPPGLMQYVMQILSGGGGGTPQPTSSSVTPTSSAPPNLTNDIGNTQLPRQLAQMRQMIYGNSNGPPPPAPAPPSPVPVAPTPQPIGEGGFWHGTPNSGMPSPTIANTPSQNNPTTPFSMPKLPGTATGAASPPAPQSSGSIFTNPTPGSQPWSSLMAPPVRGTAITGRFS